MEREKRRGGREGRGGGKEGRKVPHGCRTHSEQCGETPEHVLVFAFSVFFAFNTSILHGAILKRKKIGKGTVGSVGPSVKVHESRMRQGFSVPVFSHLGLIQEETEVLQASVSWLGHLVNEWQCQNANPNQLQQVLLTTMK